MSNALGTQRQLNEIYNVNYIRSKLLNNFFKIVISILILIKVLISFLITSQDLNFPFLLTILVVSIQYLLFLKYNTINISTNLLLITLYTPLAIETVQTGGIYSDNLLYFLLITPACILLLNIRQTIIWTILTLCFVVYLYYLEKLNPGVYFKDANFEVFYYFNAIFWLFILISGFMITSGIILNRIFNQLEQQKEQLLNQNESIIKVNEKLSETEQSLRKSNKALEQFAHATAHDLKQPLRTMSSFAKLTSRRIQTLGIEDKSIFEYLEFIQSGGEEMSLLVEQLMNYAKIKANQEGQIKAVNLNKLVERILLQLNWKNDYPRTTIKIDLMDLVITGQSVRIRQLFQNLIVNALKFSAKQESPKVAITSYEKQDYYWFCIEDNGIGIAPENHEKVFQLFTKMNTSKEFKGSGIGLSTCKEIVEQFAGKMWIESSIGAGCKIFFSIPKSKIQKDQIQSLEMSK